MEKHFIENCFFITPKKVDYSLNRIGRKIGDNSDPRRADIQYEYDEIDEQYFIIAIVDGNAPQRIAFETIETSIGERQYFKCNKCDSRCHKLYLLPAGHIFSCFKCHKIKRQTFNTSSKHGKLFDMTRKVVKLINQQENMTSRIWYKDAHTKRYSKFLNECLKVGLVDIVNQARAVESAVNNTNN
ncbi:MAG: hypothetical protein Q7K54_03265 [Candidatus Parcubacteria bacterium]|nr:hypothetical protein [Candidatus Parcubacteria bacterium]